jgi:hypothetical protein
MLSRVCPLDVNMKSLCAVDWWLRPGLFCLFLFFYVDYFYFARRSRVCSPSPTLYGRMCSFLCTPLVSPLHLYTSADFQGEWRSMFFRLLISIATFRIRHPDHIASITSCLGKQQRERARQLFLFSDPGQLPTCC